MSNYFDRLTLLNDDLAAPADTSPDGEASAVSTLVLDESANAKGKQTPLDVKSVTQELLRHGYLEEAHKSELFRRAIAYEHEILEVLEPLDLEMRLDPHRGIAFLVVAPTAYATADDDSAWHHPLVKRQRLTLEQSLLIAILRQAFALHEQEAGIGQSEARVAVDDLLPQYMAFLGDSGSDAKNESQLLRLLDQLKPYGIVSEVDSKYEVTIRPLIVYVANPESLTALLGVLKASIEVTETAENDG